MSLFLAAPACFDVDDRRSRRGRRSTTSTTATSCRRCPSSSTGNVTRSIPPTNRDYRCDHADGYLSPYSLFVDSRCKTRPTACSSTPAPGSRSFSQRSPVDLTPYRELIISMRLQSGSPPIPSEARVYVELDCKTVESESGAPVPRFLSHPERQPASNWSTYKLALANLGPAALADRAHQGRDPGLPARRRRDLHRARAASSRTEQAGRGTLFIDDLKLQ